MTVETQGVVAVAPKDQGVAVPKIDAKIARILQHLTPEDLAKAAEAGKLEDFAGNVTAAYAVLGTMEDSVKRRRTVAGAYAHRAMMLAGKAPKDVGVALGLSSGRVTQLGNVAHIVLDLGVSESEADFGAMTGKLLNHKDFRAALKDEATTGDSLVALASDILRPKASVGGSQSEASNGTATETRGVDAAPQTFERWNSNPKRLDNVESLLAALTNLSPAEWVRLHEIELSITAILAASPARAQGVALRKADLAKREASQGSAE